MDSFLLVVVNCHFGWYRAVGGPVLESPAYEEPKSKNYRIMNHLSYNSIGIIIAKIGKKRFLILLQFE